MCNCKNIEIGSYDNQVELPAPPHIIEWAKKTNFSLGGDRLTVCIDRCLEKEIKALWYEGITTTNSCCGHNMPGLAHIMVIPEDIAWMKAHGYKVRYNNCRPGDEDSFIPMTIGDDYFGLINRVDLYKS